MGLQIDLGPHNMSNILYTHTLRVSVTQTESVNPRDTRRMKRLSSKWAHVFSSVPQWIWPILTEQNGEGPRQSMRQNSVTRFPHYLNDTPSKTAPRPSL